MFYLAPYSEVRFPVGSARLVVLLVDKRQLLRCSLLAPHGLRPFASHWVWSEGWAAAGCPTLTPHKRGEPPQVARRPEELRKIAESNAAVISGIIGLIIVLLSVPLGNQIPIWFGLADHTCPIGPASSSIPQGS